MRFRGEVSSSRLVGVQNDGPGDAAVVRPVLDSRRGLVIGCGMNPHFGDYDPYHMAASSIDEAIRNCVAVGADPTRIAILDNFCWGYTDRPETLGKLVRAALACKDMATVLQTPFISGKDSLNNEFSFDGPDGKRETISIPSTLLISALGQVDDVGQCVTMDAKAPGNLIYQVGSTGDHLAGSHWSIVNCATGGQVPTVQPQVAKTTFKKMHGAIKSGLVRSCHDLSEGGLATAAAEMAFAGGFGMRLNIDSIKVNGASTDTDSTLARLFSESTTRFIVEVASAQQVEFEAAMQGVEISLLGAVTEEPTFWIKDADKTVITAPIEDLKRAWQKPLDWK